MRVYVLHFSTVTDLSRAFDQVMECERVGSCSMEPEAGRMRFLAPVKHADALVERIYLAGGLVWCSRHDLLEESPGAVATSPLASSPPRS